MKGSAKDVPSTPKPATGRLGIITPGLGAVATTFMAGVESIRQGRSKPIGSLTQMATIRLGKRTENRAPLIKEFVPLAELKDIVFGAWDPRAGAAGSIVDVFALPGLNHRVDVFGGVLADECTRRLKQFFAERRGGGQG